MSEAVSPEITWADISECTVLTSDEAKKLPAAVRRCGKSWWTRSPGKQNGRAASVDRDGAVYHLGQFVCFDCGLRPALKLVNTPANSLNLLKVGEKTSAYGLVWTKTAKNTLLADTCIDVCPFRDDWKAPKSNLWKDSDAKIVLDQWWNRQGGPVT